MPIGGWGGWQYAVGSAMLLENEAGESIVTYCLLDSDYHTLEEISERYKQAEARNIQLHIWSRKEIENFLLSASLIQRVIAESVSKRTAAPDEEEIEHKLLEIGESLRDEVVLNLATEIHARERKLVLSSAINQAKERINVAVQSEGNFLSFIPGKTAISLLSQWSQTEFGVPLNPLKLARKIQRSELAPEAQTVITAIENLAPFDKRWGI